MHYIEYILYICSVNLIPNKQLKEERIKKMASQIKIEEMSYKQRMLRYALCVDIDCMLDADYTEKQIRDWFQSDEARESFTTDELYNHENYLEVLENEIYQRYQQYFN